MDTLVQWLMSYGLQQDEASIYLFCLENGSVSISAIAEYTGISVDESRKFVSALVQKWVLSESRLLPQDAFGIQEKQYQAVSPELLFGHLQQRFQSFGGILPDLIWLSTSYGIRPKIKILEGIEGIKQVYNDTLHSQTDIMAFLGNHAATSEVMSWLYDEYVPARVKKNIYAKVILSPSTANTEYHKNDHRYHRESRILPDSSLNFGCEICLYGPWKMMVAFYHASDMCGVLIESDRLYETVSGIFTYMRGTLK